MPARAMLQSPTLRGGMSVSWSRQGAARNAVARAPSRPAAAPRPRAGAAVVCAAASPSDAPPTNRLHNWLMNNDASIEKIDVVDRKNCPVKGTPLHTITAATDLEAGDIAFSVPDEMVVDLAAVFEDQAVAELLTTNKLSELSVLALYLMYEKKSGRASKWFEFIRELGAQRGRGQMAVQSPLLWAPGEVDRLLEGSPMVGIVKDRLKGIEKEYRELDTVWYMSGSLFQKYPFQPPTEEFDLTVFLGAFVVVQSTVVHLQNVSLSHRFALVPLGPPLLSYASNCRAMLRHAEGGEGAVEFAVDRPYKKGEELIAWCGPQPNTKLLLNYGFIDEQNPHDRLSVRAELWDADPLFTAKRLILQDMDMGANYEFQFSWTDPMPEGLMDYLRVAHASGVDGIEAAKGGGAGEAGVERAALESMAEYCNGRLSGYPTTVEQDTATVEDPAAGGKERECAKLLRIEKGILLRCLEAVDDQIIALGEPEATPGSHPPKLTTGY